jgi:hypothetical protein
MAGELPDAAPSVLVPEMRPPDARPRLNKTLERPIPARGGRVPKQARRPAIGSPQDLRRAIVLATILGPCKAMDDAEPSERRMG